MTYDELIQNVSLWSFAENDDLRRAMPQIIRRAERRILAALDRDALKVGRVVTLAAGEPTLDLSTFGPLEIRWISLRVAGQTVPLEMRHLSFCEELYQDPAQTDVPRFYAEDAAPFLYRLFPTPDDDYPAHVVMTRQPAELSPTNNTNLWTDSFPNLLEVACLEQAAIFMQSPMLPAWQEQLVEELQLANLRVARGRRDDGAVRPRDATNKTGA